MLAHLLIQGGLDDHLGQLIQQPARAGQCCAAGAGLAHQLPDGVLLRRRQRRQFLLWPSIDTEPPDRVGDRLIPVGYVPPERMPIYYAAAELLAYPLVYTGFGLTLLEASACGCVPVAFNLPPVNELLPDTAWLVDQVTPRAFAQAVNAALRDPDTARKARNGVQRARSRQFSGDRMMNQTLDAYDTAVQTVNREIDAKAEQRI